MAQHIDMHRKTNLSFLTGPLDHPTDTHATERLISLIREHIGRFRFLLAIVVAEASEFIPCKEVSTISAGLAPADSNGALGKIQIIPS